MQTHVHGSYLRVRCPFLPAELQQNTLAAPLRRLALDDAPQHNRQRQQQQQQRPEIRQQLPQSQQHQHHNPGSQRQEQSQQVRQLSRQTSGFSEMEEFIASMQTRSRRDEETVRRHWWN